MNRTVFVALAAGFVATAPAHADIVTLTFETAPSFESIGNLYSASGIGFGGDALAIGNDILGPYFSNAPSPLRVMSSVGPDAALRALPENFSFVDSVSFYYSASEATSVDVLDGMGGVLATYALAANAQTGCTDSPFCNWTSVSVAFNGLARSIQFGAPGVAGFDNITVNVVPLPAAVWLLLSGLGAFGLLRRRTRPIAA